MRKSRIFARVLAIAVMATLVAGFSVAVAQAAGPPFAGKVQLNDLLGKTRTLPGLQDETKDDQPIVHAALTPTSAKAGSIVTLSVTVSLPADSHTYSMSPEVPGATRIELSDAIGLESKGDFEADRRAVPREGSGDGQERRAIRARHHVAQAVCRHGRQAGRRSRRRHD